MSVEEELHKKDRSLHDLELEQKINEKLANLDKRLLTHEEIRGLRKLMEQDARARWFWASLRTWVLAISAVIAAFVSGYEGLKDLLRRLIA